MLLSGNHFFQDSKTPPEENVRGSPVWKNFSNYNSNSKKAIKELDKNELRKTKK